ncbi:MAG: helix-turn-helix domain-containing protein [Gammaproteobacteria bacterium]|nr:helix-turn-helix domain-containing protein [Gammaproteobacteria bacterium]
MVDRKQHLVESGDKKGSIYAICNGSFKSISHSNGDSRVIDVHLPGDVLGLEAYADTQAKYDLVANERSTIAEFIIPDYQEIESASFLKEIIALCGSHFCRFQDKYEVLGGKRSTLELVASFVFSLAQRHCTKNIVVAEFRLPLTRGEIAEYLGLASETISRQFVLLEKMKIIKTKGQRITILDFSGLQEVGNITKKEDDFPNYRV